MTRFLTWAFVLAAGSMLASPAMALKEPRPLGTDSRIRVVNYNPDQVFKFVGHYGYQSSIEFAPDEQIQTVSVGDSTAWLITPSGSRMFLKPIEQDALTNMTVITNLRTYHFELHPMETEDINDPHMVFVMRFSYPASSDNSLVGAGGGDGGAALDPVPDLTSEEAKKFNYSYTLTGPDDIAPIRVFDDGRFTYFEFRDKNAEVPAFFLVDAQKNESLINFRTRGNYIVVERVGTQFTLRHGSQVVCVYNEPLKQKASQRAPGTSSWRQP